MPGRCAPGRVDRSGLPRFELHPQISVKIYDNSAKEIAELVQSGAAEFGITMMSTAGWDMELKTLFKEPFILLCPADHRFARQDSVEWADLADIELIRISPQAGNRGLIDAALGGRSEALRWRYEVQHLATAVSMVQAGLALTVVPRLAVDLVTTPGLVGVALRNPSVSRSLGVVAKRGLPLSAPSQTLLDMIVRDLKAQRSGASPKVSAGRKLGGT